MLFKMDKFLVLENNGKIGLPDDIDLNKLNIKTLGRQYLGRMAGVVVMLLNFLQIRLRRKVCHFATYGGYLIRSQMNCFSWLAKPIILCIGIVRISIVVDAEHQ